MLNLIVSVLDYCLFIYLATAIRCISNYMNIHVLRHKVIHNYSYLSGRNLNEEYFFLKDKFTVNFIITELNLSWAETKGKV